MRVGRQNKQKPEYLIYRIRRSSEYREIIAKGVEVATKQAGGDIERLRGLLMIIERCQECEDYYQSVQELAMHADDEFCKHLKHAISRRLG